MKSELQLESYNIREQIRIVEAKRKEEINSLEAEKYLPLIETAEKIKRGIRNDAFEKYRQELQELREKEASISKSLEAINIEESKVLWHPSGTIVSLWEYIGRFNSNLVKTEKTGTVQVYDGSQEIAENLPDYKTPKKGDIVVFHSRKDGSMGKKLDVIFSSGKVRGYIPTWLTESETPENNLLNEKEETPSND